MKKRLFAMFVLSILILSFFTACSDDDKKNDDDNTSPRDSVVVEGAGTIALESSTELFFNTISKGTAIKDNYLFACDQKKIKVIDVSNLDSPSEATSYPEDDFSSYTTGITIDGDYIFVYADNFIYVLNATNPMNLTEVSSYELPTTGKNIQLYDGKLYVCGNDTKIYILDISDVTNLSLIDSVTINAFTINDVYVQDDFMFVSCANNQFTKVLSATNLTGPVYTVSERGKYAGYSGNDGHVFGIGIKEASNTGFVYELQSDQIFAGIVYSDTLANSQGRSIFANESYVYGVFENHLRVYGIFTITDPQLYHTLDIDGGQGKSVIVDDEKVFVTTRTKLNIYQHDLEYEYINNEEES